MHVQHGLEGFEVGAAGIEDDSLADERYDRPCLGSIRSIAQAHDSRIMPCAALGDRQEGARAGLGQFLHRQEFSLPALFPGDALDEPAIGRRIQHVGGQCRKPPRQIEALRLDQRAFQVVSLCGTRDAQRFQWFLVFGLALECGQREIMRGQRQHHRGGEALVGMRRETGEHHGHIRRFFRQCGRREPAEL